MTDPAHHDSVLGLVESLAGLDEGLGPSELICMWFDDLYVPGQTRPNEYPEDVWERGQTEWRECFTETELKVLARFHQVYDAEVEELTDDWAAYKADPRWLRVSEAAKVALKELRAEAQQGPPGTSPRPAGSARA